ncbi:MAG TPA: ABC transporter substrate-binding protein [Actinomycetota bacterium]|nr:ABC transporter substrate-binding protein [Actinomycetota bacterium]
MAPRRAAAAAVALAVLAAGCGTRVPDEEVRRLLAEPATSDQTLGGAASEVPEDVAGSPGAGGERRSGGQGTGDPAEDAGGGQAADGSDGGGGCTSNPGATDVGVSGRRVLVGASYAESSLVPGQFRPAMDAIQAYVNMVNRQGGVCGRVLDFHFHNDGLNAQRYAENVQHLARDDRVFAMLGSLSAADSGGCGFMQDERPPRGMPDVGTFALSYCRSQDDSHYSPMGSLKRGIYGCCTEWDWLRDRFGYRRPAVHYLDIEISKDQGLAVADALVRTLGLGGRDDVYLGEHSPAQFSYTGDVQEMQREEVDAVWSSMDLNNNVKLLRAMCQQEWHPKVVHLEISAYDPELIRRVGPGCIRELNVWMRSFHRPFSNPNAEVSLYVSTLRQYCPSCRPSTFGLEGWLSAKLFVEVLRAVGPDLTRERFYRAMDAVRNWTADGVMGPNTPSDRLIYHCNYLIRVQAGGFVQGRGMECGKFYRTGDYDGPPVGP